MRKHLKRYLPDHESVRSNRWLAMFGSTLLHPRLWHLNRHSVAGGFAIGLFCGLIPGPFQMLGSAVLCIVLRANLPLALLTTLYTNPLTIVPLYFVAFEIGSAFFPGSGKFVAPPEFSFDAMGTWVSAIMEWAVGLGKPLAVGVPILAASLALVGYVFAQAAWRAYLIRAWRRRSARRRR